MPALMALYRDLHANPELSFRKCAPRASLAAEARKLGFDVTDRRRRHRRRRGDEERPRAGAAAARRHGRAAGRGADRPAVRQSKVRGTTRTGVETGVMHACGHDTHMTAWVGTARRLAAMQGPMVGHAGHDRPARRGDRRRRQGDARGRPVHPLPASPTTRSPSTMRQPAGGRDRLYARAMRWPMSISVDIDRARRRRPRRLSAHDPRPDRARQPDRHHAADPGQPRDRPARPGGGHGRQLPCRAPSTTSSPTRRGCS